MNNVLEDQKGVLCGYDKGHEDAPHAVLWRKWTGSLLTLRQRTAESLTLSLSPPSAAIHGKETPTEQVILPVPCRLCDSIMVRTPVGGVGLAGHGGYGVLFHGRPEAPPLESQHYCGLHQLRPSVSAASELRQLQPVLCRRLELSCSASLPSGFSRPSLGVGRSKVSRVRRKMADTTTEAPASGERAPLKTLKVYDHLVLYKMNVDELQEKEMLDGLYSLQYSIKDIVCSSLGRLIKKTPEGYTHGFFVRLKSEKALKDYWLNEKRLEVAHQLVIPYFSEKPGLCMVDFEAEVENDLEAVFRRGDRFDSGVEHFLIFKFKEGTSPETVEESLNTIKSIRAKLGDKIVQTTSGTNIEAKTISFFSHGVVTRFDSESSYHEFEKLLANDPSWAAVKNVVENHFEGSYVVEPISTKLM
ncbi:hypothetical protein R1sor_004740 [Riccia sorocarpa]|uniref:Stress-response A/B barrel domain-containing protein n=1 Tax=Riccia sorocarpa TaxID=122646 RepID=A0ABD3HLH4_9MARC